MGSRAWPARETRRGVSADEQAMAEWKEGGAGFLIVGGEFNWNADGGAVSFRPKRKCNCIIGGYAYGYQVRTRIYVAVASLPVSVW
jgi:hypothetical protein